jgi:hypothetical protein
VGSFLSQIYLKVVIKNINTGGTYSFQSTAEVWIDSFSDIAATTPIDISALAITANIDEHIFTQDATGAQTHTHTPLTFACTGTGIKIYEGLINDSVFDPITNIDAFTQTNFSLQPGTGYVPI